MMWVGLYFDVTVGRRHFQDDGDGRAAVGVRRRRADVPAAAADAVGDAERRDVVGRSNPGSQRWMATFKD